MGFEFFFWVQFIVAFFFGALMISCVLRYRMPIFIYLLVLFIVILGKSLFFNLMHMSNVAWISDAVSKILDPTMKPLYDLKYLLYQIAQTIFVICLAYVFILSRLDAEEKSIRTALITLVAQVVVAIAIGAVIAGISLKIGAPDSLKTSNGFVEFMKGGGGRFIFVLWKLILLIMTWASISVSEYSFTVLKTVNKAKKWLYTMLFFEIIYNVFSLMNYYTLTWHFVPQILSLLILCKFAYDNLTAYIDSISDRVDGLGKEKDMIINLMKEISNTVGSGNFDIDSVVKTILEDSVKGTTARGGAALLKDPLTNRLVVQHVVGVYPPSKPFKSTHNLTITDSIIIEKFRNERIAPGEGLLGRVLEKGESIFIKDTSRESGYIQSVSDYLTVTSFIAVPLKLKDDVFGVLTLIDDAKHFTDSDISLLETLGEQAAITIRQVQMYGEVLEKKQAEKEIGVAAEIQNSLIPHTFPATNKYDMYGFSIAAKGVGGDYYDYIDFGNNKIAMTMFDVSGKGVPASLIMVMIRSILRTIATLNEDTKEILTRLNNTIAEEIVEDRYATGFYLLFDGEKGIMCYTNAGHGPLVLYRAASDEFEFLDSEGMPVGIMPNVEYGQNYAILEKGDIAILYTDGISECMNLAHEEFGMDRFKEVIRRYKREGAREIANKVLESITQFAGNAPQHDDETLLILKTK